MAERGGSDRAARRRLTGEEEPVPGECPCRSGRSWSDCCRPEEERAQDAGLELPAADRLGELLHDAAAAAFPLDPEEVGDEDWVEDYLLLEVGLVYP